jgi:hypothetical protein
MAMRLRSLRKPNEPCFRSYMIGLIERHFLFVTNLLSLEKKSAGTLIDPAWEILNYAA